MKEIKLNKGYVTYVDECDYFLLNQWKWKIQRTKTNIYASRNVSNSKRCFTVFMHRVIMITPDNLIVDHIDHDGLNNCRYNLRNCTYSQNQSNKRKTHGTSKYMGVYYRTNYGRIEICARIVINKKAYNLGRFETEELAARAYDNKAIELNHEFANLNFKNND